MNDIYLVLGIIDKSDITTGVSLYGAFHNRKEANAYREHLAECLTDNDTEPFYIERIKDVYPLAHLVIDEPVEC